MLEALPTIATFFWDFFSRIFNVYTTCSVLGGFFTLWLVNKMFGIFDVIKRR